MKNLPKNFSIGENQIDTIFSPSQIFEDKKYVKSMNFIFSAQAN